MIHTQGGCSVPTGLGRMGFGPMDEALEVGGSLQMIHGEFETIGYLSVLVIGYLSFVFFSDNRVISLDAQNLTCK